MGPMTPALLLAQADEEHWWDFLTEDVTLRTLKVLGILVGAWLLAIFARHAIDRVVARAAEGLPVPLGKIPRHLRRRFISSEALDGEATAADMRRAQRTAAIGSVLRSVVSFVIYGIAFVMILNELGLNIAPVLTGAGILGVALGFGAQTLVKDFLAGTFIVLEDQYGVGDVIDTDLGSGKASGVVEAVGLRTTRLRDVNGVVWHVRNGEMVAVGNKSQGWSRAVLDIPIAYGESVERARAVIKETADAMWQEEEWAKLILEEPEVWGVEQLGADGVVIRLVVKTKPLEQWGVSRQLRERIKRAFDEGGIEIPFQQRTVWVRTDGEGSADDEAARRAAGAAGGAD